MGENLAILAALDASDTSAVIKLFEQHEIDAFVSGTPYQYNQVLTQAPIATQSDMTDLGGNSDVVHSQLEMSGEASKRNFKVELVLRSAT